MSEENYHPTVRKQGAPTGVIIMLLILFFPVGIILMWLKKSWKLWVKIVITALFLVITVIAVTNGNTSSNTDVSENTANSNITTSTIQSQEEITYEKIDLKKMIDDLNENALRAENTYQDKYIEITGRIDNFDSDGRYISLDPVEDNWNFTSIMCYIKAPEQKEFLLSKNINDTVTIKGKIRSIGEVLGYSIDINEVY